MSKFADDMYAALKISNAHSIAVKYECPVIYFHRHHKHAFGRHDYRAETYRIVDGKVHLKVFRVTGRTRLTHAEERTACVELAQEWANKHLGITEWVPTGFPDTWMPKDTHAQMRADLAAWRKAQKEMEK